MSTYYLIASLPPLSVDQKLPLSVEAFQYACEEQLTPHDAAAARALLTHEASAHPFVVAWRDKEAILRNAVAQQRARVRGVESARWLRATEGCDLMIERQVEEAFQQTDPLRIERALDAIRWRVAEELAGVDPLAVGVVLAYAIKLGIVMRWNALQVDQGMDVFERLTELAK
jgi:hypothetical protein